MSRYDQTTVLLVTHDQSPEATAWLGEPPTQGALAKRDDVQLEVICLPKAAHILDPAAWPLEYRWVTDIIYGEPEPSKDKISVFPSGAAREDDPVFIVMHQDRAVAMGFGVEHWSGCILPVLSEIADDERL